MPRSPIDWSPSRINPPTPRASLALFACVFAPQLVACSLMIEGDDLSGATASHAANGDPSLPASRGGAPADPTRAPVDVDARTDAGASVDASVSDGDAGQPATGCASSAWICDDFTGSPSWAQMCNGDVSFVNGVMRAAPGQTYSGGCFYELSPSAHPARVHFEQDVTIEALGTGPVELGQLVMTSISSTIYAGFRLDGGHLRFQRGDLDLGPIPTGPIHLVFDIDFGAKTVTGSVNGTPFDTPLGNGNYALTEIDLAVDWAYGTGWAFTFDNVVVTPMP